MNFTESRVLHWNLVLRVTREVVERDMGVLVLVVIGHVLVLDERLNELTSRYNNTMVAA